MEKKKNKSKKFQSRDLFHNKRLTENRSILSSRLIFILTPYKSASSSGSDIMPAITTHNTCELVTMTIWVAVAMATVRESTTLTVGVLVNLHF